MILNVFFFIKFDGKPCLFLVVSFIDFYDFSGDFPYYSFFPLLFWECCEPCEPGGVDLFRSGLDNFVSIDKKFLSVDAFSIFNF